MVDDIRKWLEDLGLGEYAAAFVENRVDAGVLTELTSEDLKDIGVAAVGDRRKNSGRSLEVRSRNRICGYSRRRNS